jgi:hypothetical protein
MLDQLIANGVEERNSDLARLDDDGGKQIARAPATGPAADLTQRGGAYAFKTPMIPGAREPGMLTTFGVHAVVFSGAGIAMDAATTAARQREGGGAPNQRRPAREGSLLMHLWQRMQGLLRATHPS